MARVFAHPFGRDMPHRPFTLTDDLRLRGAALWFDPQRRRPLAFISSACAPAPAHQRAILSPATLALLQRRRPYALRALPLPPHRPITVAGVRIELLPAGVLPGAMQALCEHAGERLLAVPLLGPLQGGALFPSITVRRCDHLLMHCPTHLAATPAAREEAWDDLWQRIDDLQACSPKVVVTSTHWAPLLEVAARLDRAARPYRVDTKIQRFLRLYQQHHPTPPTPTERADLILSLQSAPAKPSPFYAAAIEVSPGAPPAPLPPPPPIPAARLLLASHQELHYFAQHSQARSVSLYGPDAATLPLHLPGCELHRLQPSTQPPLNLDGNAP